MSSGLGDVGRDDCGVKRLAKVVRRCAIVSGRRSIVNHECRWFVKCLRDNSVLCTLHFRNRFLHILGNA